MEPPNDKQDAWLQLWSRLAAQSNDQEPPAGPALVQMATIVATVGTLRNHQDRAANDPAAICLLVLVLVYVNYCAKFASNSANWSKLGTRPSAPSNRPQPRALQGPAPIALALFACAKTITPPHA